MAASLALKAIADGWDALGANYTFAQRNFLYLPLLHSERLDAQVNTVMLKARERERAEFD